MSNLKQKLQSLIKKVHIALIKWQLASLANRRREAVASTLQASALRIAAQEQYIECCDVNEARKRRLQEKLERLAAPIPMWMGIDLSAPTGDVTSIFESLAVPPAVKETLSATELELRLAAGQATCCMVELDGDPLDWPLPCDVDIGACVIRRGVSLRTLASRMRVLHAMAAQAFPSAANMTIDPSNAQAELRKTLV